MGAGYHGSMKPTQPRHVQEPGRAILRSLNGIPSVPWLCHAIQNICDLRLVLQIKLAPFVGPNIS